MEKVETEKNAQTAPLAPTGVASKKSGPAEGAKVKAAEVNPTEAAKTEPVEGVKAKSTKKKPLSGIITLIIGIIVLVAGAVMLALRLNSKPGLRDAEYLVEIGAWTREDAPSVIWQFTSVGTGTLTTNSHINDYDFIWSIEGDQLKLETDWLYALNDEYTYVIDQAANTLTLTSDDEEWTFVPFAIPAKVEAAEN